MIGVLASSLKFGYVTIKQTTTKMHLKKGEYAWPEGKSGVCGMVASYCGAPKVVYLDKSTHSCAVFSVRLGILTLLPASKCSTKSSDFAPTILVLYAIDIHLDFLLFIKDDKKFIRQKIPRIFSGYL